MSVLLVVRLNKYQRTAKDRYMRVHGLMSEYMYTANSTCSLCLQRGGCPMKYASQSWEDSSILSLG